MPARQIDILIENLQPTQEIVLAEKLDKIEVERIQRDLPEIWEVDGKLLIADGHHRLRKAYEQGITSFKVDYYAPENCSISDAAYFLVIEALRKEAALCKKNNITHISHLKVM